MGTVAAEVERGTPNRVKRMSEQGVSWLARLEGGVKLRAYLDAAGIPTVGVGQTTIHGPYGERRVTMSDSFSDAGAALESFRARLKRDEVGIDAATRDDISQPVFDAFVSARYNIGPAFDRSTAVRLYNARAPIHQVVEAMRKWRYADGLPMLDERRACEADLILKGIYRAQNERPQMLPTGEWKNDATGVHA